MTEKNDIPDPDDLSIPSSVKNPETIEKAKLEELVEKWKGDESEYTDEKYWIQHTANECADELEDTINE